MHAYTLCSRIKASFPTNYMPRVREWGISHAYKRLLKFNINLLRSFKAIYIFYYLFIKSVKAIIRAKKPSNSESHGVFIWDYLKGFCSRCMTIPLFSYKLALERPRRRTYDTHAILHSKSTICMPYSAQKIHNGGINQTETIRKTLFPFPRPKRQGDHRSLPLPPLTRHLSVQTKPS